MEVSEFFYFIFQKNNYFAFKPQDKIQLKHTHWTHCEKSNLVLNVGKTEEKF